MKKTVKRPSVNLGVNDTIISLLDVNICVALFSNVFYYHLEQLSKPFLDSKTHCEGNCSGQVS